MDTENLVIIGSSHIAKQSVKEIREAFKELAPDIVAVELDKKRLVSLFSQNQKGKISFAIIKRIGIVGFLFLALASWVQKKLGKHVRLNPGADMKVAVMLAKQNKKQIMLIDQDIEITLRNFSKRLTWKEKMRFLADIFRGLFKGKKQLEEFGMAEMDLTKVPEEKIVKKMVGHLKKRYPNVYKVLITDRNKVMARRLVTLLSKYPEKKILAVVGAGHKKDIEKIILRTDLVSYKYSCSS